MALSRTRVLARGDTPYPWEREGIDFAIKELPDSDPFYAWELVQLLEPATGRFYELDLVVLGYSALYLIEIKSGPGRYSGDCLDWYRDVPGERTHHMDPPLRLTDHKCKVLKSMLERRMPDGRLCPRVVPLVFLSHPEAQLAFRPDGLTGVVTRGTLKRALTHHEFPGAPQDWRGTPIDKPRIKAVLDAAKSIGLRPRKARDIVGSYELGEVLEEGPGYQDRVAIHQSIAGMRRRARTYLVPEQTSVERRQQLKRAADREVGVLLEVRGSPFILSCSDYITAAERGPTVLFEDLEGALPLDAFLRLDRTQPVEKRLSFDERLQILSQLANALAYCHKRTVVHGAVAPSSLLVRRSPQTGKVETRLFNFQLAVSERTSGTAHWSQLAAESWALYQAPELREDPATRTIAADVFGLGAVAYLVFTGEAPGDTAFDVDVRLRRDRFLDPRSVDAGIPEAVVKALELATELSPPQRADDALEWFHILEEALTEPDAPPVAAVSPLEAESESMLEGGLLVVRTLGHGASSRVLEVVREKDNREYALKVSLSEEHDARLRAEARTLRALRHPRIVPLVDELVIGGRVCLLLEKAGERTLHQELTSEGPMSLEFAARYGADLLSALEAVEDKGLVHRDIKPANLGIGAVGKEAKHLTLFDFSLADAPLTELTVGTAAYRDPFLRERGCWDAAADRYSTAVTLHEMLTGVRPSWGDGGLALDGRAELTLAAERFDPAVRDELTAFFRRALARSVDDRFPSAEPMRKAWERALEEPRRMPSVHPEERARDAADLSDEELRAITPGTPVEALPLSTRAKNALDRAGMHKVEQLRMLAPNRLSAIRGIGTKVAKEILTFRDRWQRLQNADTDLVPFFPGYRGEDLGVDEAGFAPSLAAALLDAGVAGLTALASLPKEQLATIAEREGVELSLFRQRLEQEQTKRNEREHPSSVEGYLAAFLPKSGKGRQYLEALFGLAPPFEGRLSIPGAHVARHFGVTAPNLHILLGKERKRWAKHDAASELVQRALEVVREHGGAVSLARSAQLLLSKLPHDLTVAEPLRIARAAALLRIAAELDRERPDTELHYLRLVSGEAWLFDREVDSGRLGQLAASADALASRDVLASPAEATRQLLLTVEGTALERLPPGRLLELACAASKKAACSSRLELYPRHLVPERTLALTAALLKGGVTAEEVCQRASERYPLAAPLPPRPALDALMQGIGFEWREAESAYCRPGETTRTNLATHVGTTLSRFTTAPTGQPRRQSAEALTARDFDQRLRAALEDDSFRVIGVSIDRGAEATRLLASAMGVKATSFDELFLSELKARTEPGKKPSLDVVQRTDHDGSLSPGWPNLKKLAETCAQALLPQLVPAQTPLLLHQLGLIARYELTDFLQQLVRGAQARESRSVFLVVPCPDTGALPRLNGALAIPGVLPGQALWVPPEWLKNTHNAAA